MKRLESVHSVASLPVARGLFRILWRASARRFASLLRDNRHMEVVFRGGVQLFLFGFWIYAQEETLSFSFSR